MYSLVIAFCTLGTTDCLYVKHDIQFKTWKQCEVMNTKIVNDKRLDEIAIELGKLEIIGRCIRSSELK